MSISELLPRYPEHLHGGTPSFDWVIILPDETKETVMIKIKRCMRSRGGGGLLISKMSYQIYYQSISHPRLEEVPVLKKPPWLNRRITDTDSSWRRSIWSRAETTQPWKKIPSGSLQLEKQTLHKYNTRHDSRIHQDGSEVSRHRLLVWPRAMWKHRWTLRFGRE